MSSTTALGPTRMPAPPAAAPTAAVPRNGLAFGLFLAVNAVLSKWEQRLLARRGNR